MVEQALGAGGDACAAALQLRAAFMPRSQRSATVRASHFSCASSLLTRLIFGPVVRRRLSLQRSCSAEFDICNSSPWSGRSEGPGRSLESGASGRGSGWRPAPCVHVMMCSCLSFKTRISDGARAPSWSYAKSSEMMVQMTATRAPSPVHAQRGAHGVRVTSGEKWRRCEPTIAAHSPPRDPPNELGVVNGRADELVGVSVAHLVDDGLLVACRDIPCFQQTLAHLLCHHSQLAVLLAYALRTGDKA